jgi:ketosteroid isomerase-like protein
MMQATRLQVLLLLGIGGAAVSCANPDYYSKVSNVGEGGRGYTITRIPINHPPTPPTAPLPPGDSTVHETGVRKAQTDWMTAMKTRAVGDMADLMEDRFVLVGPDGNTTGKEEFVALVHDGRLVITSETLEESSVTEYGNAAVMTGIVKLTGTLDGNDIGGSDRFIDTWIWKSGKWKKASSAFLRLNE